MTHQEYSSDERPTIPAPGFDPMQAWREAAERNAQRRARERVMGNRGGFQGCERPTIPAPAYLPLCEAAE